MKEVIFKEHPKVICEKDPFKPNLSTISMSKQTPYFRTSLGISPPVYKNDKGVE